MVDTKIHFHPGTGAYPPPQFDRGKIRAMQPDAPQFPPPKDQIKSILIIKLDALGDYLLYTPFYKGLRELYPDAKITLICATNTNGLAQYNPVFNYVAPLDYPAGPDERNALLFALKMQSHPAAPFDLIIMPRWAEDWHKGCVMAQTLDARWRLSYSSVSTPMKRQYTEHFDNFYTHVIDEPKPAHEVWRGMQLLHALGADVPPLDQIKLEMHIPTAAKEKIDQLLADKNYPRPWFTFGVGASLDHKRWPGENFAELAARMEKEFGGTIFLIGHGEKDAVAGTAITAKSNHSVNCIGNLTTIESGELISRCDMMITNDSFALHAAAAAGTPAVEIIGHPADGNPDTEYLPWRFGPWGIPFACVQPLTCTNSEHGILDYLNEVKCIADIPVEPIMNAVKEVLNGKNAS